MRRTFVVIAWLLLSASSAEGQTVCGYVAANPKPPVSKGLYPVSIAQVDGKKVDGRDSARVKLPAGPHSIGVVERIADDRRGRARLDELGINQKSAALKLIDIDVQADGSYLLGAQLIAEPGQGGSDDYWEPVVWRKLVDSCR